MSYSSCAPRSAAASAMAAATPTTSGPWRSCIGCPAGRGALGRHPYLSPLAAGTGTARPPHRRRSRGPSARRDLPLPHPRHRAQLFRSTASQVSTPRQRTAGPAPCQPRRTFAGIIAQLLSRPSCGTGRRHPIRPPKACRRRQLGIARLGRPDVHAGGFRGGARHGRRTTSHHSRWKRLPAPCGRQRAAGAAARRSASALTAASDAATVCSQRRPTSSLHRCPRRHRSAAISPW